VKTNYFLSKSTACSVAWNRLGWWLGVLEAAVPAGKSDSLAGASL